MRRFEHDDPGYRTWLSENPDGYVLNVRRSADADYVVLHRATCTHISRQVRSGHPYTGRAYRKVCSNNLVELSGAARLEGRRDGSFSKCCALCNPPSHKP
jgi:hypothetical protein